MVNYELKSGCFAGDVVEDGSNILDVAFENLDDDLQFRIRDWAENQIGKKYIVVNDCDYAYLDGEGEPLNMNVIKEDYENSWDNEETGEPITLKPISEW